MTERLRASRTNIAPETSNRRFSVLGIPIDVVDLQGAVARAISFANGPLPRMVFFRDVASLMVAREAPRLSALHDQASLVLPDGMPLVWCGKRVGFGDTISRVAGPDFLEAACAATSGTTQRHYFFGGKPGVAQKLAQDLSSRHPGLVVAGAFCPPMRDMDEAFTFDAQCRSEIEAINAAKPDFIWVGLSSPKQEYWIAEAVKHLDRGVLLGVGAAFDFQSGTVRRAPLWMRGIGLEGVYRFFREPRRLARRYLVLVPAFAFLLCWRAIAENIWPPRPPKAGAAIKRPVRG